MNKVSAVLALLLSGSVSLNLYQWLVLPDHPSSVDATLVKPAAVLTGKTQHPTASRHTAETDKTVVDKPDIATIRTLLDNKDYLLAQDYLQQALRRWPDNFALLMLEARVLRHTAPLSEAVLHYYTLLDMALSQEQVQQVTAQRDTLVKDALQQLRQAGSWDAMAIFLEPLVQRDPGQADYALALATAYGEQARYNAMENALAALDFDDARAQRIRQQYTVNDPAPVSARPDTWHSELARRGDAVPLTRHGAQYTAPVMLNHLPARLLIDTGATRSAITRTTYERLRGRLSPRFIGNFTINTAGGPAEAALIELDRLTLGEQHMANVRLFVLPVSEMDAADGLLGMNVLGRFIFHLDQQNATLWLSPSD